MKICCLVVYSLLRVELKIEIRLMSLLESKCKPVNEIHNIKCPPSVYHPTRDIHCKFSYWSTTRETKSISILSAGNNKSNRDQQYLKAKGKFKLTPKCHQNTCDLCLHSVGK